jgi:hypothetical protein
LGVSDTADIEPPAATGVAAGAAATGVAAGAAATGVAAGVAAGAAATGVAAGVAGVAGVTGVATEEAAAGAGAIPGIVFIISLFFDICSGVIVALGSIKGFPCALSSVLSAARICSRLCAPASPPPAMCKELSNAALCCSAETGFPSTS